MTRSSEIYEYSAHTSRIGLHRPRTRFAKPDTVWLRYETLKAEFTATATTHEEYEAAVRRAVIEAGV